MAQKALERSQRARYFDRIESKLGLWGTQFADWSFVPNRGWREALRRPCPEPLLCYDPSTLIAHASQIRAMLRYLGDPRANLPVRLSYISRPT